MLPKYILNYEIESKIGEGSMGVVYLGINRSIGQRVAIKALHPRFGQNEALRKRFRHEAMLLSSLSHPNIVKFLNYVENENGVFLIMEYVDGDTLEDFVLKKNGLIVENRAYPIMTQILDAFQYAHERGVVHRDIKPSNIFIDKEGTVKILDFGIAKIMSDAGEEKSKGVGTYAYMSPEQVLEQNLDARSDIYSLGVVYYMMLTGHPAYDPELPPFAVCDQVVKNPLPRMKDTYAYVSDEVQEVVDKATAKDLHERYSSCVEMQNDLNTIYRPRSNKRKIVFAILAVLILLIGGGAFFIWDAYREKTKYYYSYAIVNGLPVGVGEVEESNMADAQRMVRMDYSRGRLLSMQIVGADGKTPAECDSIVRPKMFSKIEFKYNKDNEPAYALVYNLDGGKMFRLDYSDNATKMRYSFEKGVVRPDSVSGVDLVYDAKTGRLHKFNYVNSKGEPTCDADSVYGAICEYDANNRLKSVILLGKNLSKHQNRLGVAQVKFGYNILLEPHITYHDMNENQVVPMALVENPPTAKEYMGNIKKNSQKRKKYGNYGNFKYSTPNPNQPEHQPGEGGNIYYKHQQQGVKESSKNGDL